MTLEFVNGVQLKLVGHTLFGAESTMRGRLLLGKCRTTVSPGAEGYTLEAPNASGGGSSERISGSRSINAESQTL